MQRHPITCRNPHPLIIPPTPPHTQEADAARERARAAKDMQATQVRVARAALLAEQRRAMDERAAAAVAAREARVAEEQQALAETGVCVCVCVCLCGCVCACVCVCV